MWVQLRFPGQVQDLKRLQTDSQAMARSLDSSVHAGLAPTACELHHACEGQLRLSMVDPSTSRAQATGSCSFLAPLLLVRLDF